MRPSGGTEILYDNLKKFTEFNTYDDINLIRSVCKENLIDTFKINVLWQHLATFDSNTYEMNNPHYLNNIDGFVYVSEWQLEQFKLKYKVDWCNNTVIRNAIEPIEFKEKPKGKIRLIYTSTPQRGLDVLLDSFERISYNRDDIELYVYSSNIIYGSSYSETIGDRYNYLFDRCRKMKNVFYRGYTPNRLLREALKDAHIFAYPSTFEETSCLAAIEAGSAGCKIVTTNYGALSETCDIYANYVEYDGYNREELVENFTIALEKEIDNYNITSYNIPNQRDWFNNRYSWQNRAIEWNDFFERIIK